MSEREYDPETCITAGERRAQGFHVPDSIPDAGWIPRLSMRLESMAPVVNQPDKTERRLDVSMMVSFSEPFRWIEINSTIDVEDLEAADDDND